MHCRLKALGVLAAAAAWQPLSGAAASSTQPRQFEVQATVRPSTASAWLLFHGDLPNLRFQFCASQGRQTVDAGQEGRADRSTPERRTPPGWHGERILAMEQQCASVRRETRRHHNTLRSCVRNVLHVSGECTAGAVSTVCGVCNVRNVCLLFVCVCVCVCVSSVQKYLR